MQQPHGRRLALLIYLTTLAYCVTRGMKEMVLLSQPSLGAAYLPVVNFFIALPCSFILGSFYIFTQHKRSTAFAYHSLCILLMIYIGLYSVFLSKLQPGLFINLFLTETIPQLSVLHPIIVLIQSWPAVLYYTACELWGNFTLMVLFWQLANETYTSHEAKNHYPWFVTISSFGMVCSTYLINFIKYCGDPILWSFFLVLSLAVAMNMLVKAHASSATTPPKQSPNTSKKLKLSWSSMLNICLQSYAVLLLAASIILYYTLSNVLEVTLKEQVVSNISNPVDYLAFMSENLFYQGSALLCMNLARLLIFPSLSWSLTAALTPITCIVVVNIFLFSCAGLLPTAHLLIDSKQLISLGLFALVVLKTMKYAFFDVAKEMFYIPMDHQLRAQGKTVVDGMGARLGKSGYGVVQFLLFSFTGQYNMLSLLPYLMVMVILLSAIWIWIAVQLDALYQDSIATEDQQMQPAAG